MDCSHEIASSLLVFLKYQSKYKLWPLHSGLMVYCVARLTLIKFNEDIIVISKTHYTDQEIASATELMLVSLCLTVVCNLSVYILFSVTETFVFINYMKCILIENLQLF